MGRAAAPTVWGVPISQVTSTDSHPLDRYMDGLRARENESFRMVYQETADDLLSFAFGMVSDLKTAEDIVQQSFVELVKAAPKIRGDGRSLRAWLFRSVRFGCLDEYRRRSRRPEHPVDTIPDLASDVDPDPLMMHMTPELETALASLSKRHRTAVVLRHVAGLSGEEIAGVLGVSRRAAYSILQRAEEKLRTVMGVNDES